MGAESLRQLGQALLLIPLGLILLIMLADLLTPTYIHLGPLLVAAPAITAAFAGPWVTGGIGLLAIVVEVLIGAHNGRLGTQTVQAELGGMAVVTVFVVVFCLVRERERRRLVQVRSVAETVQRALLRPLPERVGPLRIASAYLAAEAEAQIGGDIYGAVRTASGTRLIVGDARGKGLAAISDAAVLLGAFREVARRRPELREIVADLEDSARVSLGEAGPEPDSAETFVTAVIVDIPDDKPVVTAVSCGHPPPMLLRQDGRVMSLDSDRPAPPLGLGGLGRQGFSVSTFPFEEGDLLLLYTDGVVEARDSAGEFYPLAARVASWAETEPRALLARVCGDLLAYVGGRLGDDAAMIAIRRDGAVTSPERWRGAART
uniref:PP2C family protein-serine/threonine phosphatase n=1 Tax=Nonomuraea pusilla TaxID=46177 RepID=UPI0006E1BD0A|nr:PP2C family protein-serine/threonine phosphatase [Nonomuraea pusilla]